MSPEPVDGRRVAITGARTFLGQALLRHLESDSRYEIALALDVEEPTCSGEKMRFESVDLTVPGMQRHLGAVLADYRIDTVVHGAFIGFPTHAGAWAHELEDVGTMYVLDACAAASTKRILQVSTTLVYGPRRDHPSYIDEAAPLSADDAGFIGDKVRADLQFSRFAAEHQQAAVTQLRFAPTLGPTTEGLFPRFFRPPIAPVMMGFDPLMQFVHEHDAAMALSLAVDSEQPVRGPLNIVGRGVLPYTTVLALLGKIPLHLPYSIARSLAGAIWRGQLAKTPPVLVDLLRYACVADGSKAEQAIGYSPSYDQEQTILDFLGVPSDEGGVDVATAGAA